MDNLRACLLWTLEDGNDIELGQRITATARRIWARGFPYEGKRWIVVARQLVSETTPAGVTVGLALAEANLFTVLREFGAALVAANAYEDGYVHGGDELALAEARGLPASR
jgi:hypothetical protein